MISEPRTQSEHARQVLDHDFRATFVECCTCGYEPDNWLSVFQGRCPKCHSFTWHRVTRKGGPMQPQDRVGRRYSGPEFRLPVHNVQAHQAACTVVKVRMP